MTYDIIRSRRRTMAAQIKDGRLIVRAPLYATDAEISDFVRKHQRWVEKHLCEVQALDSIESLTTEELRSLAEQAKAVIPRRVVYYAPLIGVDYGRITIRAQHSPGFYAEVLRVCPDYQKWHDWLRENGPALMRRITP